MDTRPWRGASYPLQVVPISQSVSGAAIVVAGQVGFVPIVCAGLLRSSANGTMTFRDSDTNPISPAFPVASAFMAWDNIAAVRAPVGKGIDLNTSTAVNGWVGVILVPEALA